MTWHTYFSIAVETRNKGRITLSVDMHSFTEQIFNFMQRVTRRHRHYMDLNTGHVDAQTMFRRIDLKFKEKFT